MDSILIILSVMEGASGGQPACPGKWKKCRKKRMNSNTSLMYIDVCHVSCNIGVMFTCTLVRSHPDSRRHWGETCTAAINSKILGWAWQQDICLWGEARVWLSQSPERGHEGHIREVP
jgi:hypothetical protein